MTIKNIISFCLFAVYSLVLAHNFIPHHHHSERIQIVDHHHHCDDDHDHHHESNVEHTKLSHSHSHEEHIHCSFEEVIVLNKKINISDVYTLAAVIEIDFAEDDKQQFVDSYIIPHVPETHCRDVQLRGPPQFS